MHVQDAPMGRYMAVPGNAFVSGQLAFTVVLKEAFTVLMFTFRPQWYDRSLLSRPLSWKSLAGQRIVETQNHVAAINVKHTDCGPRLNANRGSDRGKPNEFRQLRRKGLCDRDTFCKRFPRLRDLDRKFALHRSLGETLPTSCGCGWSACTAACHRCRRQ